MERVVAEQHAVFTNWSQEEEFISHTMKFWYINLVVTCKENHIHWTNVEHGSLGVRYFNSMPKVSGLKQIQPSSDFLNALLLLQVWQNQNSV